MRGKVAGLAMLGAAMMASGQAHAGVSEAYVGVFEHNACITNCKNSFKEGEPNVEFEVNFDSPHFLHWLGSPKPMVMASINTQGDTSYGGVGLDWRWQFAQHWSLDPSLGYVVHTGENNNPHPGGSPEANAYSDKHVLLGSTDLFRTGLGITYHFEGPWNVQGYYEHLSHGQILGHGRNQGLDELGIRVGYAFGG